MSKISSIEKNNKIKRMINSFSKKRKSLKKLIMNKNISLEERFKINIKLSQLPRNSSKTRLRNRCALTGRPRGYYRKIGISRIMFRNLALQGFIPGVIKSSW